CHTPKWFGLLGFKETSADLSAPVLINEYLPCAAVSVAKDGEAPESSPDGSLREKQHKGGTVCAVLTSTTSRVLRTTILAPSMSHCAATVLPSTNPSRVQRRRYVIHGYVCHSCSAAVNDQRRCLATQQMWRIDAQSKTASLC